MSLWRPGKTRRVSPAREREENMSENVTPAPQEQEKPQGDPQHGQEREKPQEGQQGPSAGDVIFEEGTNLPADLAALIKAYRATMKRIDEKDRSVADELGKELAALKDRIEKLDALEKEVANLKAVFLQGAVVEVKFPVQEG